MRAWQLRVLEGVDLAEHHEQLKLPGRLSNTTISAAAKPVKSKRELLRRSAGAAKMAVALGMSTDPRAAQQADARRNVAILEYLAEQAEERAKAEEEAEAKRKAEEGEDWD